MYVINSHRKKEEPFNELTIDTTLLGSASNTFVLPLYSIDHVEVDWGDGVVEHFSAGGFKTHVYDTPGIYTIKMYGTGARMFRFSSGMDSHKVIGGVIGNTGWTSFDSVFSGCSNLATLDVSGWDVSTVTTFSYAFANCSSLTALDVSNWDVSAVTSFFQAFFNCSYLTTLDVSTWDVSAVTSFVGVFYGCNSLTSLDVGSWDVSNVTDFGAAFRSCYSLLALDVSNWNVSSVTNFSYAFYNCSNLALFDASAWVMSANLIPESYTETFKNCGILDLKIGSGWNFRVLTEGYNASSFLQGTNIGSTNYDNMLYTISKQPIKYNVIFGGGNSKYTTAGKVYRDAITERRNWTIIDGGLET